MQLLLTLALVVATALAQDPKSTGTVEGTILTTTKLTTRGTASQRDFVVYLEPKVAPTALPAPAPATVSQAKLTFVPHVLVVQKGAEVTFRNDDAVTHNVLLEAKCCSTDADMEKGASRAVTFPEAGAFPIACRLHPEMAMQIIVVATPWFAQVVLEKQKGETDDKKAPPTYQANFAIAGVPPGDYVLKTWNKRLPAQEQEITIKAGEATHVELRP